jgi:dihydrofolate reductase
MPAIRVEGYAVISEDGMIADAAGGIPPTLIADADQKFFERGLDDADVLVHGRNSEEHQPNSPSRHRIKVTHRIAAIAADAANPRAVLWNPANATFEDAVAALNAPCRSAAILGGTDVFGYFLDRFDVFFLSRIAGVRLPGGRPVFPQVPAQTPERVLTAHGLRDKGCELSDPAARLIILRWERAA